MSCLSDDKKSAVISALCEGVSIRATGRLFDVHRDTVMHLGVKVGQGCAVLHGLIMRNLRVNRIELDEVWSFVKKKRHNVTEQDTDEIGDQYVFMAMDSTGKAILTWLVGKRTAKNTHQFVRDLRKRIVGAPTISTDGFAAYVGAIDVEFGENCSHGVVDKQTVIVAGSPETGSYYARETMVNISRHIVRGNPSHISTSYIERQNLTLRQSQRRLTRMSTGFSKKYENHCAAISLYAMHYNFCRVHNTLRITPAMQLGVTDHVWTISELVQTALTGKVQNRIDQVKGRFRVIDGGKS